MFLRKKEKDPEYIEKPGKDDSEYVWDIMGAQKRANGFDSSIIPSIKDPSRYTSIIPSMTEQNNIRKTHERKMLKINNEKTRYKKIYEAIGNKLFGDLDNLRKYFKKA